MSLSSILDELQDGVQPIATEFVTLSVPKGSPVQPNTQQFDRKVLDKFNVLYNKLVMKQTVGAMVKLDRKIAQEVFTMLPELDPIEQGKLTSFPSVVNRDVTLKALDGVSDELPEDVLGMLKDVAAQAQSQAADLAEVLRVITDSAGALQEQVQRLSARRPLVIVNKTSRDLLSDPLGDLSYMDDTALDYPKYAGVLCQRLRDLASDPSLIDFLQFYEPSKQIYSAMDLSLQAIVDKVLGVHTTLASTVSDFEASLAALKALVDGSGAVVDERASEVIAGVGRLLDTMNYFAMLHTLVHTENNFLVKLQELLVFLD